MQHVDKQQILKEIGEIIADVLDVSGLNVTMNTTAEDVEGWDSFNHINIVVAVEEHFKVKMNTAEIEELRNVGGFVELIEKKPAGK